MSILVGKNTKVIVQGLTGSAGTFHAKQMREYGTAVVGGVTPGKGGTVHEGFPVFDTVTEAVAKTGANASVIYVPPPGAADAIVEAAAAGIEVIVCITEGIPILDMVRAKRALDAYPDVAAGGAQLPGRHHPGRVQDRDHARLHPHAGSGRHRVAVGDLDLRGRPPADRAGDRPVDRGGHRRRSGQGLRLHRLPDRASRPTRRRGRC